ncbi:putative disease resistance protein [Senna tora]|uniref:Putative disease resistance protein n=1 Tax=Senna tora TaxID=362788 RepID=A0A834XCI1_9FABA|nr:putative disease resistance protein [Senna tora]
MAAETIGTAVATEVVKPLVTRAMKEASYLCCYNRYVEDYEEQKRGILATMGGVLDDVEEARQRNETLIDKEAENWLNEVKGVIIQEEDSKTKKKWLFGLCTNCIWQYKQGKNFAKKALKIPTLIKRKNNLVRVARPVGPLGMKYHFLSNFMHFESRKTKYKQLKEALKNNNNHFVGLQGMGGTGKTTIATQVGKLDDAESLWSRITNGGEKILIILDDVWERELDLKSIGIPVGLHDKGRCSVFLTTRDLKVCKAMGCQETIQIDVLPNEEALNLFLSHAVERGVDSSGDFEDVALDIVKWCGGLPVAIKAIAKSVKSESLQVWKDTSKALQKFDPILFDVDGGMIKAYNCLKLSYDNLKNEKAKELFLLCSLFPEDFEIPVELLSRIAIGLGLCGEVDEYNKARRQVQAVKRKLVDSSLLLKDEEKNVRMHDLVHEVAIKIANKDFQVVRDSKTTLKENVRFSSWIDGFPDRFIGSKLEILIIFITSFVKFSNALFEGMTKLRVLVINNDWQIQGSLWVKSIQSLVNIRTLRLTNLKLEDISGMGNLQSLETLELFHCSVFELPNEITKLENLRLLSLTKCVIERNNPFKVIEKCKRLEELYYRNNSDNVTRQLDDKEVCDVGIPRTLQMYEIIVKANVKDIYFSPLLRHFKPDYFQSIFSESAFKFLAARAEVLELHGQYGTGWTNLIPDMNDLIKLSLKSFLKMECLIHTKNIGSEVTIFAKLVKLKLSTMSVKELCCGPFPTGFLKKLEKLHLNYCSNLEGTLFKGKLDLGKLKCIKLEKCSMSSLFHPSTAQSLKQLETLDIRDCCELKYIITDEGLGQGKVEDDLDDPNEMSHGSMFSKLKFVQVGSCEKLEFILPIHFVEDLPLLKEVKIRFCGELKHIFGQHQDEGVSYQKGKEIKLPSLKEMRIYGVPNFINIFPAECCHHPMSPMMKKSSTTKDDLKVKDPSLSCTFSWALVCFNPKSTATSTDNPIVYEATLPNRTGLQELKTQVFNPAKCFLRPPLDPRNLREIDTMFQLHMVVHTIHCLINAIVGNTPELRYVHEKCDCHDNLSHQSQPAQESSQDVPNMNTTKCLLRQPLLHLTEMTITSCSNWTSLFTLSIASSMSFLESLEVKGCDGLKHIVTYEGDNGHDHMNYNSIFPNLKQISIWNCSFLEYIFPASHCRSLNHLEIVKIFDAHKLSYVFGKCSCECEDFEIQLPALKFLRLRNVPNMVSIGTQNCDFTALSLETVDSPPSLAGVFQGNDFQTNIPSTSSTKMDDDDNDEYYEEPHQEIVECIGNGASETNYQLQEGPKAQASSSKKKLSPSQNTTKCLLRQPLNPLHLTEMEISYCSNLASLFTLSIASSMSLLESLQVTECHGLKHIVTNEGDNGHDHMNYSSIFPNLQQISIRNCSFLEYIFPASHFKSFNHLESVRIIGVNKLRYVFGKCYCEDNLPPHNQNVEIHLPALKVLLFDDVPNLVTIGTENYHFAALSLNKFECPPNLVGVFQGIDFQTNIPPTSSTKMDDDDNDEHYEESHQEIVEYNGNLASETNYQLQVFPKVQAALPHKKLSPSQSKKEEIENELAIQMKNNNTHKLKKSTKGTTNRIAAMETPSSSSDISTTIPQQIPSLLIKETEDSSVHGGPKLEKAIMPSEIFEPEPSNASSIPFVIPLQNESPKNNEVSSGERPSSKKDNNTTSSTHLEPEIASRSTLTSTEEFHEKESMGDQEALGEIPSTFVEMKNSASNPIVTSSKDTFPLIEFTSSEPLCIPLRNESPQNTDASVGDGSSSEKYNKPSSSTHCSITTTKELNQTAGGVDKPQDNSQDVEVPTKECSSEERSNITTALAIPLTLFEMKDSISSIYSSMKLQTISATTGPEPGVLQSNEADISGNAEFPQISPISSSMKPQTVSTATNPEPGVSISNQADISGNSEFPQDKINQTEVDSPKQFEEDDLIRLFQIMEEGADMEVNNHMPRVSKTALVEDDNKVAKAFADLEVSLKMGLNEIASCEENSLRLQNALNLLSNHFSEDGPPSHGLSATIDSLHQEFHNILSSFKQASSTVHAFAQLEEKEKCMINEELPRRKQKARTLVSEIFKTEKSMVVAQQKEAELKEKISRLQAEMISKEKEIKDCEIKLLSLQEQKKKSVSETMRFMMDFEDVKKDKSQMKEEEIKARQELEAVDVKWSSCVANLRKTTLLLGNHLNHKL